MSSSQLRIAVNACIFHIMIRLHVFMRKHNMITCAKQHQAPVVRTTKNVLGKNLWEKPKGAKHVFAEALIAFLLILSAALFIYALGRRASPKPTQSENERAEYACGEKAPIQRLKISMSLYKYLIYFAIFDSAVLLLAFAALSERGTNVPIMILYLSILLASSLILLEGGKDQ
jgi:NADH:ubiquinone oxidoreductase subunit 3 (subunit A)